MPIKLYSLLQFRKNRLKYGGEIRLGCT